VIVTRSGELNLDWLFALIGMNEISEKPWRTGKNPVLGFLIEPLFE
jgi:hypothetical protein